MRFAPGDERDQFADWDLAEKIAEEDEEKQRPEEWNETVGVFFERGAWWAEVTYRLRAEDAPPDAPPAWEPHTDRLGPFKRPRNAQVEAERHATFLQRRHGDDVALGP